MTQFIYTRELFLDHYIFPKTNKVLHRPSLRNYLHEKKVTLVAAAPGCGKSTAIASYLASYKTDYCWVNMDERIQSAEQFFTILSKGMEDKLPESARISGQGMERIHSLLHQAILHHSQENPFCIIIDNFHLTNSYSEIQEGLGKLCEESSDEIRFFFISRETIQYSFRKTRANKELVEIGTSDFIFHLEEIKELCNDVYGFILNEMDYEKIYEITGGWITAITYLTERLHHLSSPERKRMLNTFFTEKSLPELNDFIKNDILKTLTREEEELLIRVNRAKVIVPELIEEFSTVDGKSFLSTLEKKNLFIQLNDPSLYTYRFFSFFSQYLNQEFAELDERDRKKTLLSLCHYYERQNKPYLAIQYLLEGGETARALHYLTQYSEELMQTGEYDVIRILLEHFSEAEIEGNLLLSYYRAISNSILHPGESQKKLLDLLPQIQQNMDYDREAKLYTVLLTSYFFYQSSGTVIGSVVSMASKFLEEHQEQISRDRKELLFALIPLGQWWISPAKDAAFEAALRAEEISHRFNNQEAFLCTRLVLTRIYLEKGEFREARHLLSKTEALFRKEEKFSHLKYYRTLLCFYLGDALFYMGDLPMAIKEVQKGLSYASQDFAFRPYLQINLILYNLFLDDHKKAEVLYNEIRHNHHGDNTYLQLFLDYMLPLLIAYRNRNKRRTDYFCHRILEPENTGLLKADYPSTYIILTEVLIFLGNNEEATKLLGHLTENLSPADYPHSSSAVLGLTAILENRRGNKKEAKAAIDEMSALLTEKSIKNLEICDPLLLREMNDISRDSVLPDFPRMLLDKETEQIDESRKPLEIHTMGSFKIFIQGREISSTLLSGQKRVMDLMKFLIVFRKNGVMKERIYELFWPRYSYKSARDNLNTIIYRLRKLMGDSQEYLITDVNNIRFNPECTFIDVDIFQEYLSHAQRADTANNTNLAMKMYRESVSLYRGDFLEGDLYYDFIRDERENLQGKYRNALFRMVQLCLSMGEYTEALGWGKQLLESDPLCEAAYRLIMICSAFVGSRSEIPRLFDKLNKKLQTYYRIQADEKTVLLKDRLLAGEKPSEQIWMEETII